MLRTLFYDPERGDPCRVTEGLTMLFNLVDGDAAPPEVRRALGALAGGLTGGTAVTGVDLLRCKLSEAMALGLSPVPLMRRCHHHGEQLAGPGVREAAG